MNAVRAGQYSLVLGAGFSAASVGSDGKNLPIGDKFAEELAALEGLPKYPLPQLTTAIDPARLASHVLARFVNCKASHGIKYVSRFVWQHAFTFNVDDVLADCYASPKAQQTLHHATFKDNYFRPADLRELPAVYLHGSVQTPAHGFVFSTEQYGASIAQDSRWFKIFADLIMSAPAIFVGCSLNEPDVFYHLARREGVSPTQQLAPSLFVSNELDGVKTALCAKFGLVPVVATADGFFEQLLQDVGIPPSPLQLVLPAREALFVEPPPLEAQRVFFRQWLLVEPGKLPHMLDGGVTEPHLLTGIEPRWAHIERADDVIRQATKAVLDDVAKWTSLPNPEPHLRLVQSLPGQGKTTFLMRLAYELARLGVLVFHYNTRERVLVRELLAVLKALKRPVVVTIDRLSDHGTQFADFLTQATGGQIPIYAVATERQQMVRRVTDVIPSAVLEQVSLSNLSRTEGEALIGKMRHAGLLGRSAKRRAEEIIPRVQGRDLFAAIVELNPGAKQLPAVVHAELGDLSTEGRRLYVAASLAHSRDYPLKSAVLIRASGLQASAAMKLLYNDMKHLLRPLPPLGEYYETRHRIIADEVIRQTSREELLQIFVDVARGLAPYVNTKTYARGTEEARLAARLLDYDSTAEPLLGRRLAAIAYDQLREAWGWNNRYWVQLALMKLPSDPLLALQYAENAVGIENHYIAQTTRAKVLFRLARSHGGSPHGYAYLLQAFEAVDEALRLGRYVKRANVQALDVAIRGTIDYYRSQRGRDLNIESAVDSRISEYLRQGESIFIAVEQRELGERWRAVKDPAALATVAHPSSRAALRRRPRKL